MVTLPDPRKECGKRKISHGRHTNTKQQEERCNIAEIHRHSFARGSHNCQKAGNENQKNQRKVGISNSGQIISGIDNQGNCHYQCSGRTEKRHFSFCKHFLIFTLLFRFEFPDIFQIRQLFCPVWQSICICKAAEQSSTATLLKQLQESLHTRHS